MKRLLILSLALTFAHSLLVAPSWGQNQKTPVDRRLTKQKTLNDYFPFSPPKTRKEWELRQAFVKDQVRVANGLLPLPKKTPMHPVIHGKIMRDDYTIEKVYFQSYPGFYVTGNLYRPRNVKKGQKVPGVLCPHGHWSNGRFYKNSAGGVKSQIKSGAEKTPEGAMYPLQARCATLARLGCTVFHYDMIGYADSRQMPHRKYLDNKKIPLNQGFVDPDAVLWQQNKMGLQTWNSIRSLDFLLSLSEVDAKRIGVTGASGGGTQTFILCAVDDRPAVAFPAVMVSTAMQGGCICENSSYLRLNTGNIELAGLFAPKPLAMSAANDWTKEIESKGLPQLKDLYKLYGAADKVNAKAWINFGHNYNQVAREFMYNWFNKHLKLGHNTPVVERPFVPVPPDQLSVWNEKHPFPKMAISVRQLRDHMTAESRQQLKGMFPKNPANLNKLRDIAGTALRVMVNDSLPSAKDIQMSGGVLSRKGQGEAVGAKWIKPKVESNGTAIILVLPKTMKVQEAAAPFIAKGASVLAVNPFATATGTKIPPVNNRYHGYTWGYNRTILANRVHDILTAVAHAKARPGIKMVHLVGIREAGPWVVMARALCGDAVGRTAADLNQFRFEEIVSMNDEMMQPGALKYGGLQAFTALNAPNELFIHNTARVDPQGWIAAAYKAANQAKNLRQESKAASAEDVATWVLR